MSDSEILGHIRSLVDEEHALRSSGDDVDKERVKQLEVTLDQCWDLLRQRRAHREFGQDESGADVREARVVEDYQQ